MFCDFVHVNRSNSSLFLVAHFSFLQSHAFKIDCSIVIGYSLPWISLFTCAYSFYIIFALLIREYEDLVSIFLMYGNISSTSICIYENFKSYTTSALAFPYYIDVYSSIFELTVGSYKSYSDLRTVIPI